MNSKDYLKRFQGSTLNKVSLMNLAKLQNLHLQRIPFENLDVIRKVPIYLNLDRIYEKIVHNSRGGYCYEVNGLFNWLLSELGYDAHLAAATVLKSPGEWAKQDTHVAIIVHLDQPYLVDVGFGAATPSLPIPINGDKRADINGEYWINQQNNELYDLVQRNDIGERTLYRFSLDKRAHTYFHEGCVFNQVSKESAFTHADIVTIATETGRITLSDQTLTIVEYGVAVKNVLTEEQKARVLRDSFNLII